MLCQLGLARRRATETEARCHWWAAEFQPLQAETEARCPRRAAKFQPFQAETEARCPRRAAEFQRLQAPVLWVATLQEALAVPRAEQLQADALRAGGQLSALQAARRVGGQGAPTPTWVH